MAAHNSVASINEPNSPSSTAASSNGSLYSEPELHEIMLQSSAEQRLLHLRALVENSENDMAKMAKILLKAECWLSDVVRLGNVDLTRAFLLERDSMSRRCEEADIFVPPELVLKRNLRLKAAFPTGNSSTIDDDSRASVDHAMSALDAKIAEVILKYGADRAARLRHFFANLATMSTKQSNNLRTLDIFVQRAIQWNIIDDEASQFIEREIFQKANVEAVEVFMRHDVHLRVEKSFGRNALTALYGNPNVNFGFLKKLEIDVNARGAQDFTALHYAMQNCLLDKVKHLLDRGAEVDAMNWKNETPLILALREPQIHTMDNKDCAKVLLQYGADPFVTSWEGKSFDSCIQSTYSASSSSATRFLMELALAYVSVHEAAGAASRSANNYNALKGIDMVMRQNHYLAAFYMKCKQQLRSLKEVRIRSGLTMFTIVSMTGDKLLGLLGEDDRRIVNGLIARYARENGLHHYYREAFREHMRQFRKFLSYKNRAIFVLAESAKPLAHCSLVLDMVAAYLDRRDLLVFQSS